LSEDYNLGKLNDEFDAYLINNSSSISNVHITPQYFQLDSTVGKILSNRGVSLPFSIFKKYSFRLNKIHNAPFSAFLTVPYGENLFTIFAQNKNLRKKIIEELKKYELTLINIQEKKEYVVQKTVDGDGIQFAYSTIADTFQRLYFHLAAIESNKNSTLIFEEPEAHAFPPYIVHFTQAVINSTTNQFFMATHSPFVLDDLMENARHELAVFVVDWKNGETVVHALTDEQLEEVYQYGVDLFTNIEAFS
jgi:AAA15 family ATPase/GTPase